MPEKFSEKSFFAEKLEDCKTFSQIFSLVKEAVENHLEKSRTGLMLGISNLGGSSSFFIGAYYAVDSNIIVLNEFPLKVINEKNPELMKPYVFQVLLHEYLHSLDYLDEATVRKLTYIICEKFFGKGHIVSKLVKDISAFLPQLAYPNFGWFPEKEAEIYVVEDFDMENLSYVS